MYPIASTTVGSGGTSTITFSSIPSTFTHLQVRLFVQSGRGTYNIDDFFMRVNGDSGNNYTRHYLMGNPVAGAVSGNTVPDSGYRITDMGTSTGGTYGASIVDILDYTNTNKNKTFRSLNGNDTNGSLSGFQGSVSLESGLWINTAAINSITIASASGNLITQYSTVQLYGITTA